MFSDVVSAATEMVAALGPLMRDHIVQDGYGEPDDFDLRADALLKNLRKMARERRAAKVGHYLTANYALSVEKFYGPPGATMPEEDRTRIMKEMSGINLDCSLLIAHMGDHEPMLFNMTPDGDFSWEDNYSGIGSGYAMARGLLCQNRWDNDMSLMECVVRLKTAKRFAEQDPMVGKGTQILVMRRGFIPANFTDAGSKYIAENMGKISWPEALEFQDDFLEKAVSETDDD
jgi:hypothetical protein